MQTILELIKEYPIYFVIGVIFVVVTVNKNTGETTTSWVETSQSRDEMRKRNKSALETRGEKVTESKKTRNGWFNDTDDTFVSGQIRKDKPPSKI